MNISSEIFNIPIINNVIIYEKTDSTNNIAKSFIDKGCVDGTLILAKEQTAGKGRLGRSFSSPAGEGIYMSLVLKPDISLELISQITLPIALSIVEAIKEICDICPKIKWPNDIIINGKKIVGILTELKNNHVIIGIGINVNNSLFSKDIASTATSIYKETGKNYDFSTLIQSIFKRFQSYYDDLLTDKSLSSIQEAYNKCLISYGSEVYIIPHVQTLASSNPLQISTAGLTSHICKGIDSNGCLICISKSGEEFHVNSGEVSVRGLHGYAK